MSDTRRVEALPAEVYRIGSELTEITGRACTPDGHLVGGPAEWWAAKKLGLTPLSGATKGVDAVDDKGHGVQIKMTSRKVFGIGNPEHVPHRFVGVVVNRETGKLRIVYDGPGKQAYALMGKISRSGAALPVAKLEALGKSRT